MIVYMVTYIYVSLQFMAGLCFSLEVIYNT